MLFQSKLITIRITQRVDELIKRAKPFHNQSKFIREAISEKFERDYPKWIEEQKRKQAMEACPF